MESVRTTRRPFVQGLAVGAALLELKWRAVSGDEYRTFEDIYRNKRIWDREANRRLTGAISRRGKARGVRAVPDEVDGGSVRRDYKLTLDQDTMGNHIQSVKDLCQYISDATPGIPTAPFADLAAKGIICVEHPNKTIWDHHESPCHDEAMRSLVHEKPHETFTGRRQFYIDQERFIKFDEQVPDHRDLLRIDGYPLHFMMGDARHGIRGMWRDDSPQVSLQRGESDLYVNPGDAAARGVRDKGFSCDFERADPEVAKGAHT